MPARIDQVFNLVWRVGDAQARREGLAIILWGSRRQGQLQPLNGLHAWVEQLAHARRLEQAKGSVPAQPVVDGQLRCYSPGIHGVEPQSLNVLRKAAVPCRRGRGLAVRAVKWRQAVQFRGELIGVGQVKRRVLRKDVSGFCLPREGAAQDWLVDKVDPKLGCMPAHGTTHIVSKLVFLLIANHRKRGDGSNKLVVAVGFETGDGLRSGAERKRQGKAEVSITVCRTVQITGAKSEISHPRRAEGKGVADDAVLIIGVRYSAGGG